jgi:hypothetical protein
MLADISKPASHVRTGRAKPGAALGFIERLKRAIHPGIHTIKPTETAATPVTFSLAAKD